MRNDNGGIIGPRRAIIAATNSTKSGIWTLSKQQQETGANNWRLAFRYLRYTGGAATASHHPKCARIILTVDGVDRDVIVFVADNCADSGTIPGNGSSYTLDLGVGNSGFPTAAKIYSSYGAGTRGANYAVAGSNDNTNWTSIFSGNMTSSACGIIVGTIA